MSPEHERGEAAVVAAFLARCLADRQAGAIAPLASYQAQFPGYEGLVEREYGELSPGASAPADGPGTVGPYRLLERLGEGGMGSVWLAEQESPVRRRVALKLIKLGMDTREVVARFAAERQALALMDHPNIARVHDAGVTAVGRPYFVMEHVPGLQLTRFCDQQRLPVPERLRLLMAVCEGVQHAHQKGILHRDLKPGNVLVARVDGKAVPKIIDFGLAKAVGAGTSEQSLLTGPGRILGTLEYMSPEQAGAGGLDVDTRADIYALGVILYELLVGVRPFDRVDLRDADDTEICRRIREEEPVRPSARLAAMGGAAAAEAALRRSADRHQLARLLRGDLDWIVLKALAKERDRRYASASELAVDLGRHLVHEPVLAGPPSRWYRLRKYARRHRGPLAAAAVLVPLLSGLVGFLIARQPLVEEGRRRLRADALDRELDRGYFDLLRRPEVARQHFAAALALAPLDGEATTGLVLAVVVRKQAAEAQRIVANAAAAGLAPTLVAHLRSFVHRTPASAPAPRTPDPTDAVAWFVAGSLELSRAVELKDEALVARAFALLDQAVLSARVARPRYHLMRARALALLPWDQRKDYVAASGQALLDLWPGEPEAVTMAAACLMDAPDRATRERAVELGRRAVALDPTFVEPRMRLAAALANLQLWDESLQHLRTVVAAEPDRAMAWSLLAKVLACSGRAEEGVQAAQKSIALGGSDPVKHETLALALAESGDHEGAAEAAAAGLRMQPRHKALLERRAHELAVLGRLAEAEEALVALLALEPRDARTLGNLGGLRARLGDRDGAIARYRESVAADPGRTSSWLELTHLLRESDEPETARAELVRWTQARPQDPAAWRELARFLVDPDAPPGHRDPGAALEAARKAVEAGPDDPESLAVLGEAQAAAGDATAARATLVRALEVSKTRGDLPPAVRGRVRSVLRELDAASRPASRPGR